MAKNRLVNTRFWDDNYIMELDPSEKLLFLYLITNPRTDICGGYELPLRIVAVETGIDRQMVEKILQRFEDDGKIVVDDGWVWIKNFSKHQMWNKSMEEGAKKGMELLPLGLREKIDSLTLCIDNGDIVYTNRNRNRNLIKSNLIKSELEVREESKIPTPSETAKEFFQNIDIQEKLISWLIEKQLPKDVAEQELQKFISYWTEPTLNGKKMRWQLQKTFDVKRRLVTWLNNCKQFSKTNLSNKGIEI